MAGCRVEVEGREHSRPWSLHRGGGGGAPGWKPRLWTPTQGSLWPPVGITSSSRPCSWATGKCPDSRRGEACVQILPHASCCVAVGPGCEW